LQEESKKVTAKTNLEPPPFEFFVMNDFEVATDSLPLASVSSSESMASLCSTSSMYSRNQKCHEDFLAKLRASEFEIQSRKTKFKLVPNGKQPKFFERGPGPGEMTFSELVR
jgi:hypothetical protein